MAANDWGIKLWDEAGAVVFDTADYSGRYIGSLAYTGPQPGFNFNVPNKPAESELWIKVEYYNVTPEAMAQAIVTIVGPSTISVALDYVSAACVTVIHYGWR